MLMSYVVTLWLFKLAVTGVVFSQTQKDVAPFFFFSALSDLLIGLYSCAKPQLIHLRGTALGSVNL